MAKFHINYQRVTDWQVVVEADSAEEAEALLLNDEVNDFEPDFIQSDLNYDTYDISEVE
jgi:hypothetical protein